MQRKVGGTFYKTFFQREDWEPNVQKSCGNLPQNLFRREDWETNAKKSWGNLPQNPENLFRGQPNLPQGPRGTDKTGRQMLGEPSTEPFSRPTGFAPRNARGGVCPKTFTMAKDPKANGWGKNSMMLHSCHLWLDLPSWKIQARWNVCSCLIHIHGLMIHPSLAAKLAEALGSRAFVLKSCPPDSL